ncbi:MAG: polymer-forming cytoskeletal protein [Bacteroidota bacterium]|nr:polymer-forming cytoskeletal protein [Bacteroidota bacterium]
MAKTNGNTTLSINLIAKGTSVTGDIETESDFRIDGSLNGSIKSKRKIIIGETGIVNGKIICKNADFSGKIKANIIIEELLNLKATANVTGEITTKKISIAEGAIFTANCKMSSTPDVKKEKTK